MTKFRPCIDLHAGSVKQIVGGTLSTTTPSGLKTNWTSEHPAAYYAALYKQHALAGAHVIMLGPGNDAAAQEALAAWPGGMQVGGGISDANAGEWIARGADKVIVTSHLFPGAEFSMPRLQAVLAALHNDTDKLVVDLSCRRKDEAWFVATDKWQTMTDFELNRENIQLLEPHCAEFLIHAADVEGLQRGIDHELVSKLAEWCSIPVTYAGGGRALDDLELVKRLSGGKVDLTIGSALDIFGGTGVDFAACVAWNAQQ
ncbi:5-proFAR isomerase [Didymella exigua CBS 183.55]|uniref:1-(5-phosphoribosyl)-5-[(5-phosphoribosylamino)methylideneamino] imidazole-4-carboxamide isomerase n=1 Tax=Didymella exigua CBS 183.55 TaxID=1150837 RepID=A0A6A5S2Y8_9PLEO|nr:5-proFAR isomerase [Didymella exigua CBS 183.55]KAF1933698.1 5-proFAR isomerase [Didymella exigua CBS 183.55]